jgi:hypothetical protein
VAKGKIMSQMFVALPSSSSCGTSSGPKAIAPTINQKALTIAIGAGAAYADLLATIAAGSCAVDSGIVQNKGCSPIRLEIVYVNNPNLCDLDGNGCPDSTTVLPSTKVTKTFDVPANSAVALPAGLVVGVKVATLDVLGGALTANTAAQSIFWSSDFQPSACGCVVVPA